MSEDKSTAENSSLIRSNYTHCLSKLRRTENGWAADWAPIPTDKCSKEENRMNAISYYLNWMGPVSKKWTDEHGEQWATGRIDVHGTGDPYGEEIAVHPMHKEDWHRFREWLDDLYTKEVWTLKQLVEEYEKTHPKILWLYGEPI